MQLREEFAHAVPVYLTQRRQNAVVEIFPHPLLD
jgi:hypothetical protein